MSFTLWLSSSAKRHPKRSRRAPMLELLEDRRTPATLTVNTVADVVNPTDGTMSLRDAIAAVNAGNANGLTAGEQNLVAGAFGVNDYIQFSSGLNGDTITLSGTALEISKSMTIAGLGGGNLAISGNGQSRVFTVDSGTQVNLTSLTIQDGSANFGGGIFNTGTLTVSNCTLASNAAAQINDHGTPLGGDGGGIDNAGALTVNYSTLSGNSASVLGGAIYNQGTLAVNNSNLTGNSAEQGGGIANYADTISVMGTVALSNSSLTNNTASGPAGDGGGIYNLGTLTVSSSNLMGNVASQYIMYGAGGAFGGGLYNAGTLTLSYSNLAGNAAAFGGGIENYGGTLTVSNSTLSGNSVNAVGGGPTGAGGAGIDNTFGTLTVTNSTFVGNTASDNLRCEGGGILNSATLTVTNCTLMGNSVTGGQGGGGGIANDGASATLTVTNSTLAGNSTSEYGGGIANLAGSTTLNNTIVANSSEGGDLYLLSASGSSFSGSYDLIGDGSDLSSFTHALQGNPLLAPLGNNGGPTQTLALLPGSPAIDAGNNNLAVDANGKPLTTDQRGAPRIQGAAGDLGAFESRVTTPLPSQTVGVFDPATATWYLNGTNAAGAPTDGEFRYGGINWYALVGDFTGDGQSTVVVVDPSTETWYIRNSNSAGAPDIPPFQYGAPGWIPVVGDWNGSGVDGIGVVDPATATWYLRNEASAGSPDAGQFAYGAPGWLPVVGNWTGNVYGADGIGMIDPATETWYLRNTATAGGVNYTPFAYGAPGWTPVVGAWTASGPTGIGVYDSTGTFYLRNEVGPGTPDAGRFAYGAGGWTPLAGHWVSPSNAASMNTVQEALVLLSGNDVNPALDQVFAQGSFV